MTGPGDPGSMHWIYQRDQTVELEQFEKTALRLSPARYSCPPCDESSDTMLTFDKNVYGA